MIHGDQLGKVPEIFGRNLTIIVREFASAGFS